MLAIGLKLRVTVVSVALLASWSPVASADASVRPCGIDWNYLVGARAVESTYGVKATIDVQKPELCGAKSASLAWVMLAGGDDEEGWAQAGYAKIGKQISSESGFKVFTQWVKVRGGKPKTQVFGKPTADDLVFKAIYHAGAGKIRLFKGSKLLDQTRFNPIVSWTEPWESALAGETFHGESDIPGISDDRVRFVNVRKRQLDGTWVSISGLGLAEQPVNVNRYKKAWVDRPHRFDLWTHPLDDY